MELMVKVETYGYIEPGFIIRLHRELLNIWLSNFYEFN